jgi:uncharacterized membrane protein YhaH (DUF805 family)
MLDAIKHGLAGLINFNGRDARQAFWYYVLFIYVLTMAISMVVVLPMTIQIVISGMKRGIESARGQDPVLAQAAVEAAMRSSMSEIFPVMMWVGLASAVIMLVGLSAAVVRRLHDSDLSGYWALIPAACQAVSIVSMPSQMAKVQEAMQMVDFAKPTARFEMMQGSMTGASLLGWVAIAAVIAMGVRKSTLGPNRFGDAPFVV